MHSPNERRRIHTDAGGVGSAAGLGSSLASKLLRRRYGSGSGSDAVRPVVLALLKLIPAASAVPLSLWQRDTRVLQDDVNSPKAPDDLNLWLYLGIAVALVLLGGIFAGLTIALMGQDETYLQVIATSGEASERKAASSVLNLLKKGKHWVLVTLLLSNVITNETLPIVLDRSLGGGWPAVLSSTVLIVIFGEVAPQSVCVRYGLSIGSYMAPFVLALMYLMFPVAWPTAKLLDYVLGEDHGTTYKKAGLKTLVQLHKTLGTVPGERLMEDEVTIISSVLDLKDKPVGDIMTPMQDVFTMSADTVLDERMMDTILSQGYSRIPVYAPDNSRNFIGMLLVKILITYDPEDCMRVRDFALATLPETAPYTSCLDIINFFQEGKSHMVLVSDFPGSDKGALGVVTLEDVIEELIGEEIVDESDVYVDVHKAIRRVTPAPRQKFKLSVADGIMSDSDKEGKESGEDVPLLNKGREGRHSSLPNGQQPTGTTTLLMRRKSSVGSDSTRDTLKPIPVRSNTADLKQHLKHLGPSNAANKPRSTKYTSVKIKPGVGTIPEGQATTTGLGNLERRRSDDGIPVSQDSESMLLLQSAGKVASGGVSALRTGYGTTGPFNSQRTLSADNTQIPASQASRVAEENTTSPPAAPPADERQARPGTFQLPEKLVVGEVDQDTIGEMEAPSRDQSKPRRTVRSGSITETTVDAGGMKKVVLETTSSSEELEEAGSTKVSQSNSNAVDSQHDRNSVDGEAAQDERKKRKKRGKRKKGDGSGSADDGK